MFAIASATTLAHGDNPTKWIFNQTSMRTHLYRCLMEGKLTPFPGKVKLTGSGADIRDDLEVFCYCRMPEMKGVPMIECTSCSKWFHIFCVGDVNNECMDSSNAEWLCRYCI